MNDHTPLQLREALHRMADEAPPIAAPSGLYRQARKDRRRSAVVSLAVAAAVALIAWSLPLSGGLVRGLTTPGPSGTTGTPGVPSRIYPVPDYVLQKVSSDENDGLTGPVEPAEDVGQLAVVFKSGITEQPVGISARDGSYHLLDVGASFTDHLYMSQLALSPDGNHLAFGWGNADTGHLSVVDLAAGTRTILDDTGRFGRIVWSSDSRWLAWSGRLPRKGKEGLTPVISRLSPTGQVDVLPARREVRSLAIDSSGRVLAITSSRVLSFQFPTSKSLVLSTAAPDMAMPATLSPDGASLGVGRGQQALQVIDLRDGTVEDRPFPDGLYQQGARSMPLAWLDQTHIVTVVSHEDEAQLVVMTGPSVPKSQASYRIVGRVPEPYSSSLTVATDLMTLDRPTVDRPEPDWPWSPIQISMVIGAGVASILIAAVLILRSRRITRVRNA